MIALRIKLSQLKYFLALSFLFCFHFSNGQQTFKRICYFNQNLYGLGTLFISTSDGGFLTAGYDIQGKLYLWKLDNSGGLTWAHAFQDSLYLEVSSISQLTDSGFIIAGAHYTTGYFIFKIDAAGSVVWTQKFGPLFPYPSGFLIIPTRDSGFVACKLFVVDNGGSQSDWNFAKYNSAGQILWERYFSDSWGSVTDGIETADGELVFAGWKGVNTFEYDAFLFKTDSSGNVIWGNQYSSNQFVLSTVKETFDKGFILSGNDPFGGKEIVMKTDSTGNINWHTAIDTYSINDAIQSNDSNYIIIGSNYNDSSTFIAKLNQSGDSLWTKKESPYLDGRIFQTPDSGFALGGVVKYFGNYTRGIIKTDAFGNTFCSSQHLPVAFTSPAITTNALPDSTILFSNVFPPSPLNLVSLMPPDSLISFCSGLGSNSHQILESLIFPNPAGSQISVHSEQYPIKHISIYNLLGEKILSLDQSNNSNNQNVNLDVSEFLQGIYFVSIETEKGIVTQKFIKQ